jgi:hypothetical protein
MLTVESQILFLLMTTGVGWIGGLFYDVYSLAFRLRRPRGWRCWLWDLSFWFIMLGLTYGFLLETVWGEFRVSMLGALFFGVLIYRWTFRYNKENKKTSRLYSRLAGLSGKSANK